jgi:DNA-directed RNA polymerase subunit RPC12/RpoP
MSNLKLPYALNRYNELVPVLRATKEEEYHCPLCNSQVILKEGEVRTKHFSHPKKTGCSNESVEHLISKLLIQNAFKDNAEGKIQLKYEYKCQVCKKKHYEYTPRDHYSHAELEVPIDQFICDVVAFNNQEPLLAVEVCHRHSVDKFKAESLNISWVEVASESILKDPTTLKVKCHSLYNVCGRSLRLPKDKKKANKYTPENLVPVLNISGLKDFPLVPKEGNRFYRTAFFRPAGGEVCKIYIPEDDSQSKGRFTLTSESFCVSKLGYLDVDQVALCVTPYEKSITAIPDLKIEIKSLEECPLKMHAQSINQNVFVYSDNTFLFEALIKIPDAEAAYSAGFYTVDVSSFKVSVSQKLILDPISTKLLPLNLR